MQTVTLESPYAATKKHTVEEHISYAQECVEALLREGLAPFASHLLYTQPGVLDDNSPKDRALGIEAGLTLAEKTDMRVFAVDYGMSRGMLTALERTKGQQLGVMAHKIAPKKLFKVIEYQIQEDLERAVFHCETIGLPVNMDVTFAVDLNFKGE